MQSIADHAVNKAMLCGFVHGLDIITYEQSHRKSQLTEECAACSLAGSVTDGETNRY